jgi:GTP-binding protein HflX
MHATRVAARERAALVGLVTGAVRRPAAERSLEELGGLAEAAGAEVVLRVLQERPKPDPSTFIGAGKTKNLAASCAEMRVDVVIFDNELTPAQLRQIEEEVDRKVIDRTQLILDIFARRAKTREGKLQVELAQLKYLLPRLVGAGAALSRLGGGIGTRGPGETKLETDRRRIRTRIHAVSQDIELVRKRRAQLRERRHKASVPTVALVGYTNAGKTTLFNRLTRESAYAADRLFATLDARAGRASSPRLPDVIFVDTVGLVRKLPTSLVASFRSTLAEIRDADLILHVIDASSARADEEERIASETFEELGVEPARILPLWNKADLAGRPSAPGLRVSARTGDGIERLETEIARRLRGGTEQFTVRIPYASGKAIAAARASFRVLNEEDRGDALELRLEGDRKHLKPLRAYVSDR